MPSGAPTLSCHILLGASPFDNLAGHVNSAISVLGGDGPVEFFFIPFLFQRILLGEKHFLKTLNILVYIETKNKFPKWEAGKQREKKKKNDSGHCLRYSGAGKGTAFQKRIG